MLNLKVRRNFPQEWLDFFVAVSKDWHHAGKDRTLLCTKCRLFFKKYGEERPLEGEKETPSFLFKPVKEEEEESINGKHNMRTRRSTTSVS